MSFNGFFHDSRDIFVNKIVTESARFGARLFLKIKLLCSNKNASGFRNISVHFKILHGT